MAVINGILSVSILDDVGVTASFPVYVQFSDTDTVAHLIDDSQAWQDLVDPCIDGQITACRLDMEVPLFEGIKTTPADTAEAEKGALMSFSQAAFKYKQGFFMPTVAAAQIVNGKIVLTTGDPFDLLIRYMVTGGSYLTFASKFLSGLVALLDIVVAFRKHRKREKTVSFEPGPG